MYLWSAQGGKRLQRYCRKYLKLRYDCNFCFVLFYVLNCFRGLLSRWRIPAYGGERSTGSWASIVAPFVQPTGTDLQNTLIFCFAHGDPCRDNFTTPTCPPARHVISRTLPSLLTRRLPTNAATRPGQINEQSQWMHLCVQRVGVNEGCRIQASPQLSEALSAASVVVFAATPRDRDSFFWSPLHPKVN